MSYSYIKSVFPNFEASANYNEKLYNSLDFGILPKFVKSNIKVSDADSFKPYNGESNLTNFAKGILKESKDIEMPQTKLLENLNQIKSNDSSEPKSNELEKFEGECKDLDCNAYIKHVMGCNKCKELFKKQLNLNNDEYDKQEIMELASYIIFGIFIILLIDYIQKRN